MKTPTERILVLGDIHGNLYQARRAIDECQMQDIDTILQVGDFGIWPGEAGTRFRKQFNELLEKTNIDCYFVDGNHEDFSQLWQYKLNDDGTRRVGSRIHYLPRGYRWEWHGVRFLAMGGAHSVDRQARTPNISWWDEEHIRATDVYAAINVDEPYADVMVTHDSPTNAPNIVVDEKLGAEWFPAEELLRAEEHRTMLQQVVDIVQPRMLWHGHYHRAMSSMFSVGPHQCFVIGLDEGGNFPQAHMIVDLPGLAANIAIDSAEDSSRKDTE